MTITYTLLEDDLLQYQLYASSISKRVKKNRLKSLLLAMAALTAVAFIFYQNGQIKLIYAIGVAAILTLVFYPLYLRDHYKNHYSKYIKEHYKNRFGESNTFGFGEASLDIIDKTGESKINYYAFESMVETGAHFFLTLKTGGSLIIPKLRIQDLPALKSRLGALALKLNIPYHSELNWKWR